jgi:hypothetical protein
LYLLGQNHEAQIARVRAAPNCTASGPPGCVNEAMKAKLIDEQTKEAAEDYSRIITRYPIMDRVDDAKRRLAALHQPIPRPTKAAVAQNKAEDASRRDSGMFGRLMGVVRKGPDVATATKVGEPTLNEPTPLSAQDVTQRQMRSIMGTSGGGEKSLSVEKVNASGVPDANEPVPRSDTPAPAGGSPFAQPAAPVADPNELTPTAVAAAPATPDPNELKPTADASGGAPLPPPPQINEIQQGQGGVQASSSSSSSSATTASDANAEASDKDLSSSKKKKKKGLKKIVPF